jgi:hypothetical protein
MTTAIGVDTVVVTVTMVDAETTMIEGLDARIMEEIVICRGGTTEIVTRKVEEMIVKIEEESVVMIVTVWTEIAVEIVNVMILEVEARTHAQDPDKFYGVRALNDLETAETLMNNCVT